MVSRPCLLHQVCIGLSKLTLHAQWVAEVELLQVVVVEEVLSELWYIAEALCGQGPVKKAEERREVVQVRTEKWKDGQKRQESGGHKGEGPE